MALSYFDRTVAGTEQLWVTDGTIAGTHMVRSFGTDPIYHFGLKAIGSHVYFTIDDGSGVGRELWTSDGTTAGTVLVKDIFPGAGPSWPVYLTNFNGTLFFNAQVAPGDYALWRSDGTAAGTVMVKDASPPIPLGLAPYELTVMNGTLFFGAQDANLSLIHI